MPFRSIKQRKYMFAKHPAIAKRWVKEYGGVIKPLKKDKKNAKSKSKG